jgi:menaquinone-specific isochorismate synthase
LFSILNSSENLIPYGQWTLEHGFMGITPELFFYRKDNQIKTMALAGTSAKDLPPEEFLSDAKERSEHDFVVQDIKEKLSNFGDCQFSQTHVLELPFLNHLKTDITLSLNPDAKLTELIQKMHPTSALGVYPKNDYWDEFVRLPYQTGRGTFGAPWGFSTGQESLFVVSIRRLEWNQQQVRIGAGCGIVEQSVLDKEIAEIERKINSVKKVFIHESSCRENVIHE